MKKVLNRMKKESLLNYKTLKIENVSVAVSGGVDSMVLLHFLKENFPTLKVNVLHVNHGLREESNEEEKGIKKVAEEYNYPFFSRKVDVKERMLKNKESMEMAARFLRYEFFEEAMFLNDSKFLLLGHHGDDLLETMLMREVNGSSNEGIISMRFFSDRESYSIIRPFLDLTKEEIYAYAKKNNLLFFEDSSNKDLSIVRNRYRNEIVPLLKKENKNVAKVFLERSERLAEDEDFFKALVDEFKDYFVEDVSNKGVKISLYHFVDLKPSIQRRVLKDILNELNPNKSYPLNSLEQLHEKFNIENLSEYVHLFGDVLFVKGYNSFYLLKEELTEADYLLKLRDYWDEETFEMKKVSDFETISIGAKKDVKVSKYWFMNKIPKAFRNNFYALFEGDKIKRQCFF